jgi:4-amino-4-deoxy-L-arabinose transferase-like glycosyltransferase
MQTSIRLEKQYLLIVLLIALFTSFTFQGSRGLYESTEGRYAECGLEMVKSHDYMTPTLNGVPHWTKPPLTYWVIAAGIKIFGKNESGARIGNSVAFFFSVIMLYALALVLWNKKTAFYAGLIYATSPFAIIGSNSLSTDELLTLWELSTVFFYWLYLKNGSFRWSAALGISAGLAFLTKGPPGLLTILVIILYHQFAGKQIRKFPVVHIVTGLLLFAITGLSWYVYSIINNPDLLGYFLGKEVYARIATNHFNRHPQWYAPLYVYGLPLISGLGAWVIFFRNGYREFTARISSPPSLRQFVSDHKTAFFLVLWFIIPLIVLSISKSRLPLYVLPLVPVIALAVARLVVADSVKPKTVLTIALVSAFILVGLKKYAQYVESNNNMGHLYTECLNSNDYDVVCIFDTKEYFGLQFYTFDKCIRIAEKGDPAMNVRAVSEIMNDSRINNNMIFFTDKKNRGKVESLIDTTVFHYNVVNESAKYLLYRINRN